MLLPSAYGPHRQLLGRARAARATVLRDLLDSLRIRRPSRAAAPGRELTCDGLA